MKRILVPCFGVNFQVRFLKYQYIPITRLSHLSLGPQMKTAPYPYFEYCPKTFIVAPKWSPLPLRYNTASGNGALTPLHIQNCLMFSVLLSQKRWPFLYRWLVTHLHHLCHCVRRCFSDVVRGKNSSQWRSNGRGLDPWCVPYPGAFVGYTKICGVAVLQPMKCNTDTINSKPPVGNDAQLAIKKDYSRGECPAMFWGMSGGFVRGKFFGMGRG